MSKLEVMQVKHKSDKQEQSFSSGSISFNFSFLFIKAEKLKCIAVKHELKIKRASGRKILLSSGKRGTTKVNRHWDRYFPSYG